MRKVSQTRAWSGEKGDSAQEMEYSSCSGGENESELNLLSNTVLINQRVNRLGLFPDITSAT